MLYHYSILPLFEHEIQSQVADIVAQAKGPSHLFPLFMMTLVPEGDPVWDKAEKLCGIYAQYRDALLEQGVESGILVQASLGHGYPITRSPFSPYVRFTDGGEEPVCCPMDEGFLSHFSEVLRTLAKAHPKAIMLDDDFRLLWRPGRGCACPKHMAEFNRRAGTDLTREELFQYLISHPASDPLSRIFTATQQDSLIHAVTRFRAAIDRVDPSIQGILCTTGLICEAAATTAPIFAGKGNPAIVRVPNGVYYPNSNKKFSQCMLLAAVCGAKLRHSGIDVLIAETDTLPFNRYAKSARYLHSQYAASLLEGVQGAKHWLTRLYAHEPDSGKAYRHILAKHAGLYEKLCSLSREIRWVGANSYFIEQKDYVYRLGWEPPYPKHWATYVLERMGIPFYFSQSVGKANLLEGSLVADLSDEEIEALLQESVVLDGEAAQILCKRGYQKHLGVDVRPWDLGPISAECFDSNPKQHFGKTQPAPYALAVNQEKTQVLSENLRWVKPLEAKILAPASTCLERENGRISAVFCGSMASHFSFEQSFAYLTESRKKHLVSLLKKAGALPVYLVGDDEVCLRAGWLSDGRLLVCLYPLSNDPVEQPVLSLEKSPVSITALLPDGTEQELSFTALGEDRYALDTSLEALSPAFLLIR